MVGRLVLSPFAAENAKVRFFRSDILLWCTFQVHLLFLIVLLRIDMNLQFSDAIIPPIHCGISLHFYRVVQWKLLIYGSHWEKFRSDLQSGRQALLSWTQAFHAAFSITMPYSWKYSSLRGPDDSLMTFLFKGLAMFLIRRKEDFHWFVREHMWPNFTRKMKFHHFPIITFVCLLEHFLLSPQGSSGWLQSVQISFWNGSVAEKTRGGGNIVEFFSCSCRRVSMLLNTFSLRCDWRST